MNFRQIFSALLVWAAATAWVVADEVELRDGHPDRYVVQPGDTLWDISARFLEILNNPIAD